MHEMAELREAKKAAREAFGHIDGVEGIGIGDDAIRAYIRDPRVRDVLPDEIDGVRIECVVVGDVVASSAQAAK